MTVRPLGVERAERLRAENGNGGSASLSSGGRRATNAATAVPPACGKIGPDADGFRFYGEERVPDFHECARDAGHDGPCRCACGQEYQ